MRQEELIAITKRMPAPNADVLALQHLLLHHHFVNYGVEEIEATLQHIALNEDIGFDELLFEHQPWKGAATITVVFLTEEVVLSKADLMAFLRLLLNNIATYQQKKSQP